MFPSISNIKLPSLTNIEDKLCNLYKRFNVDYEEKLLLYPKYRMHEMDTYISPSYYDTIYQGVGESSIGGPTLESNFTFH
jgi:hypothetical protein